VGAFICVASSARITFAGLAAVPAHRASLSDASGVAAVARTVKSIRTALLYHLGH